MHTSEDASRSSIISVSHVTISLVSSAKHVHWLFFPVSVCVWGRSDILELVLSNNTASHVMYAPCQAPFSSLSNVMRLVLNPLGQSEGDNLTKPHSKSLRIWIHVAGEPHTHPLNNESSLFPDSKGSTPHIGVHVIHKASP